MPHHTYVRRNRLRWALSQAELADLLGVSQSIVSRFEAGDTVPDLRLTLALQVVFGQSPRALFSSLYASVENNVMANAAELDRALSRKQDHTSQVKRRLLTGMAHRAGGNRHAA